MTVDTADNDDIMMDYEDADFFTVAEDEIVDDEHDETEPAAATNSNVADQLYLDSRAKFTARMLVPIDDDLLDASKGTMGDPLDETGTPNALGGGNRLLLARAIRRGGRTHN